MSEIMIVKNDPLVGSDGDYLYDGQRVSVGFDELVVTTYVADDGSGFERTTSLPDGSVHSVSPLTKAGFAEAVMPKVLAGLGGEASEEEIEQAVDVAWDTECAISAHSKVFIDAIVDGELTQIEKKITYIEWTER